jgi:hypothetical protein
VGVCDEVAIGDHRGPAPRHPGAVALSVVGIDDHEFAEMFAHDAAAGPARAGRGRRRVLLAEIADPGRARTVVRIPRASSCAIPPPPRWVDPAG